MGNLFQKIKVTRPKSNKFDLSHERKFSMKMGKLVPCFVQEFIPGDSFRVSSEMLVRLPPMVAPVMHRMSVYVHFFKVPNRLVWDEWQDFITGGRLGTSMPVMPHFLYNDITFSDFAPSVQDGSLWDYMGLPSIYSGAGIVHELKYNALAFRAYQLIYDEYYRDQNLEASLDISKASGQIMGAEIEKLITLRDRAWEKDYFTSCLPWAQRGDEVLIPLEGDVEYLQQSRLVNSSTDALMTNDDLIVGSQPTPTFPPGSTAAYNNYTSGVGGSSPVPVRIENIDSITNAVVTINDLRTSVQLQKWLEANARGGSRYIEQILVHFGVKSSDARLQRPEYLGGGKANVVVSEVLSTAQFEGATDDLPQGNMAGHGVGVGHSNQFSTYCEEHGWIIGICSFLPTTAYQQGIPRQFSRMDKYDYYWREFAHLGEQAVLNKEVYIDPIDNATTPEGTFGYQARYAEYKYQPSTVHGAFRTVLSHWHMGRIFNAQPSLNSAFVKSDPTKRIFAVTDPDTEDLYVQLYNRVDANRLMPYFGTPSGFGV